MDRYRKIAALGALLRRRRKALFPAGGAVLLIFLFWTALPCPLFREPLSPVLLSADGRLMGARLAADEQWRFPRLEAVPDRFFQVLVRYEDSRFYSHNGVDPLSLGRALFQNIKRGRVVSGGSTLTMQVVRLFRKGKPRTVPEKMLETILALRLEMSYTKNEILSLYAAHAPFGGNIVGIDAASWFYFGRSPEKMSWAEAAYLAVLPNNPGLLASPERRERLKEKRDRLLGRLKAKGLISGLEHSLALAELIPERPRPVPRLAPHFLDTLIAQAKGQRALFRSCLHSGLQQDLTSLLDEQCEKLFSRNIRNAAVLVVDNRTAAVAAYVGNAGLGRGGDLGQQVDLIQSPRSTGSILKPFLYAAMLQEGGLTPRTLVPDIPTHYSGFIPENFDRRFRGAVPAQEALAWSLNVPAVKMLRQFGIPRFHSLLRRWGITTLDRPPGGYGLTLILGGAEGTLLEITGLYAKLAQLAMAVKGGGSEIRFLQDEPAKPSPMAGAGLGPGAAYLTLEALTEVNRPDEEGFWKKFSSSKWVAWKTGTSYGLRDAWAVGVTPAYTVGVWAGNADGEGNSELTGLAVAAPILFAVINRLETGGAIRKPASDLKGLLVCRDSGMLATDLCPTVRVAVPQGSHFNQPCLLHQLVHLDRGRRFRVDSSCLSVEEMVHEPWFVLPAVQEFYYRRYHPEFRALPPFRSDCGGFLQAEAGRKVMSLVYPEPETAVFIPIDLDGRQGQVVFEAVHRDSEAVIYWHLDENYLGSTRHFHQVALRPDPGEHRLILVDGAGRRLERSFRVLDRTAGSDSP
ncbi:MAG: penicillin-binding protein 1C [Candidatus Aminicenantales bacterium]